MSGSLAGLDSSLTFIVLAARQPLPAEVEDLLATGLAEGQAFLSRMAANWQRASGPYEDPRAVMLVVREGGVAVGMAGVVVDDYAGDPGIGRLKHVYVRASHRRRGIAEAMVRTCLGLAESRFRLLRLRAATPEAARLYERHGFVHHPGEADYTHLREAPSPPDSAGLPAP